MTFGPVLDTMVQQAKINVTQLNKLPKTSNSVAIARLNITNRYKLTCGCSLRRVPLS